MAEILSIPASVVGLLQAVELVRKSLSTIRNLKNTPAEARRLEAEIQNAKAVVREIENMVQERHQATTANESSRKMLQRQIQGLKADANVLQALMGYHHFQDTAWGRFKVRMKWAMGLETRLVQVCDRLSTGLQLTLSLYTMYLRISTLQLHDRLDTLTPPNFVKQFPYPPTGTTFVYGSARVCAEILAEISPTLYRLSVGKGSNTLVVPVHHTDWLQEKVHGLLHDIFSGDVGNCDATSSATNLLDAGSQDDAQWESYQPRNTPNTLTNNNPTGALAKSTIRFFLKSISLVEAVGVDVAGRKADHPGDHPSHDISIAMQRYRTGNEAQNEAEDGSFTKCRLYVAMTSGHRPKGVIVQLFQISRNQLQRTLRTFGIHPVTSQVFEHINNKDTDGIRRMLSLQLVAPNDRDEEGNSLLWYCIKDDANYEVCELLLREGADPSDCNRRGDHILAVVVMRLSSRGKHITTASLKLIDLLLTYSQSFAAANTGRGSEPTATLRYKRRNGEELAPAGLIHCTTPRGCTSPNFAAQLPLLVGKFVQPGRAFGPQFTPTDRHHAQVPGSVPSPILDIELSDKNGNTALLYAFFYHPVLAVVKTATYLLDAGADISARNKYGEGPLHLLCRRLTACSIRNLSEEVKSGVVRLLARLVVGTIAGGRTVAKCDPVERNQFGYTPIDATMSPVTWPLFCEGLKVAGRVVKAELRLLDFAAGVGWEERELEDLTEAKVKSFRGMRDIESVLRPGFDNGLTFWDLHGHQGEDLGEHEEELCHSGSMMDAAPDGTATSTPTTCYLCGGGSDKTVRPEPFDEFFSDVVMELGQGLHMTKYRHKNYGECLRVHEEDSCYPLDYHPATEGGMLDTEQLRGRSWRRHVAAALWDKGLLD